MHRASWKDPSYYLDNIFVEESCLELPYTQEILQRADLPWTVVADRQPPNDLGEAYVENLSKGKRQLFLCNNRGQFFKPCPATREYQCCDYQVLSTGANCPIDCVYCILQAYLNAPWLYHYVNTEQLLGELELGLSGNPDQFYRIGTGEFTDSLALDRITCLSKQLVPAIGRHKNAVLELKTKSGVIENLEDLPYKNKTIIAWSLNSPPMMQHQEIRAATFEERLEAAKQCAQWGYQLAFHFDPIVKHDRWQEGYRDTIVKLYKSIPAQSIAWISLGALRYLPQLKDIGMQRFPKTRIYSGEFIKGLDGKERYFRPIRTELYKHIYNELVKYAAPRTCIYFCMESDEIWKEVMGFTPNERGGLGKMLDEAVRSR